MAEKPFILESQAPDATHMTMQRFRFDEIRTFGNLNRTTLESQSIPVPEHLKQTLQAHMFPTRSARKLEVYLEIEYV